MNERYIPRYSPRPIDAYSCVRFGVVLGPAASSMLNWDGEAWNLAWLSHEYERDIESADPKFTTLVALSTNMDTVTGTVDPSGMSTRTLRELLRLPPSDFYMQAELRGALTRTPLHAAYGQAWLDRVRDRAHAPWQPAEQSTGMRLTDAARVLSKIAKDARTT